MPYEAKSAFALAAACALLWLLNKGVLRAIWPLYEQITEFLVRYFERVSTIRLVVAAICLIVGGQAAGGLLRVPHYWLFNWASDMVQSLFPFYGFLLLYVAVARAVEAIGNLVDRSLDTADRIKRAIRRRNSRNRHRSIGPGSLPATKKSRQHNTPRQ